MSWLDDLLKPKTDPTLVEINNRLANIEMKAAQLTAIVGGITGLTQGQARVEQALANLLTQTTAQIDGLSSQSTQLTKIERMVQEVMSKADELRQAQADVSREVSETKEYVKGIQTSLDASLKRIEELIQQDADDAELRAAVEEVLPGFRADVDNLDKIQHPDAPPAGDTPPNTSTPDTGEE